MQVNKGFRSRLRSLSLRLLRRTSNRQINIIMQARMSRPSVFLRGMFCSTLWLGSFPRFSFCSTTMIPWHVVICRPTFISVFLIRVTYIRIRSTLFRHFCLVTSFLTSTIHFFGSIRCGGRYFRHLFLFVVLFTLPIVSCSPIGYVWRPGVRGGVVLFAVEIEGVLPPSIVELDKWDATVGEVLAVENRVD